MITRSQMRRQLRAKGGIMNAVPRQKYGFGDFVRKLIPNELADIAVKAAPFVAPFNPGIAAAMRGIGRYDQRGDFKDALKQGALTYGFGKGIGKLGGASGSEMGNIFGRQKYSMEGFKDRGLGRLFQEKDTVLTKDQMNKKRLADLKNADSVKNTPEFMKKATEATIGKVPGLNKLPSMVQQKLLVGSITSGASALYSYFTGAFEPQQPGETTGEYMARRNARVRQQMRGYMDNYYTPLRNPQYAAMSDEEKDNFIKGIVGQAGLEGTTDYQGEAKATGGRVGYQTGGITMANTLAENMRRNLANQQAVSQQFQAARSRLPGYVAPQRIAAPTPTPIEPDMPIGRFPMPPGGDVQPILPVMPDQPPPVSVPDMPIDAPTKIIQPEERVVKKPIDIVDFYEEVTQPGGPADDMMFTKQPVEPDPNIPVEELIDGPVGTPTYNDPLPYDQLMAGFAEWKRNNPDKVSNVGTMAIVPVTLPGGYEVTYSGGAEANNMRQYLESIGQAPMQRREYSEPIKSIGDGSGLAKLAGGGMPMGEPRVNKGGITELDYRAKGGFVPVGIKEKADDVPAMLSKNEFVFTADAVRGAGNGSVEKGAQKMYDTMKNLERRVT